MERQLRRAHHRLHGKKRALYSTASASSSAARASITITGSSARAAMQRRRSARSACSRSTVITRSAPRTIPARRHCWDACDRLGMMVMDEYCDMWYIHKTMYDYADYVQEWYERDITDMIEKDYNHPCVILYSLGNEVAETAQAKGIEFFKQMKAVCKRLDPERPVTTGVNIFFNLLHSLGFGVYSDKKAKENPQKKVGSEFFNTLTGIVGDSFMKNMARLHGCDVKTRGCFAAMGCRRLQLRHPPL